MLVISELNGADYNNNECWYYIMDMLCTHINI